MKNTSAERRSFLFTVRVWSEDTGHGGNEWRGQVRNVVNGETLYFRGWQALLSSILGLLPSTELKDGLPGDPG